MRITVRLEEDLGLAVSRLAGGNLAGWVRGLIEREVGGPSDSLESRVDRLEDFQALIEVKMQVGNAWR